MVSCPEDYPSHLSWVGRKVNPFDAEATFLSKAQECKDFGKPLNPCHVGIHWIALAEHSQMSTHLQWFQSSFSVFASICIGQN